MEPIYIDLNEAIYYMIEAHTYALQNVLNQQPGTEKRENAVRGALAFEIAIEAMQRCQRDGMRIFRRK